MNQTHNDSLPKCCRECKHRTADDGCAQLGKKCVSWLNWFRREWNGIREAARRKKEGGEKEHQPRSAQVSKEDKTYEHRTKSEN